jgi:hypothetical protein
MAISARMVVHGLGSSTACVVVDAFVAYLITESRTSASNIAVYLGLLAMILWRYLSGELAGALALIFQNYGPRQYLYGHCGDR